MLPPLFSHSAQRSSTALVDKCTFGGRRAHSLGPLARPAQPTPVAGAASLAAARPARACMRTSQCSIGNRALEPWPHRLPTPSRAGVPPRPSSCTIPVGCRCNDRRRGWSLLATAGGRGGWPGRATSTRLAACTWRHPRPGWSLLATAACRGAWPGHATSTILVVCTWQHPRPDSPELATAAHRGAWPDRALSTILAVGRKRHQRAEHGVLACLVCRPCQL